MLFSPAERAFATAVKRLHYANPFDDDAISVLREEVTSHRLELTEDEGISAKPFSPSPDPFANDMAEQLRSLLERLRQRGDQQNEPAASEVELYEDLVVAALWYCHFAPPSILDEVGDGTKRVRGYRRFHEDFERWTSVPFPLLPFLRTPAHAYAIHFQIRRALTLIWELIRGESRPARKLRAATWHSIFPRELRLYGQVLFERMQDVTTLILGPSGTGKELVATAIGLSRFVPFDPKRECFAEPFAGAFHAINLSAMSRELIESEIFGHAAGAFTGATKDREGWFEKCKERHTVFLDEIGELAEPVQVKLLRVLQNREFYRVGDTQPRRFEGRVIAATNRDFAAEFAAGRFRQDVYFRLCSDIIRTPSLREQLDDAPEELPQLVSLIASRCLGDKAAPEHGERLTKTTVKWIERAPDMGWHYAWPGNFRELEQCVRSVMVRGEYHPPVMPRSALSLTTPTANDSPLERFVSEVKAGQLTFDEVLEHYCSLIFARRGNLNAAARQLKKHRATVNSRIRPELVRQYAGSAHMRDSK